MAKHELLEKKNIKYVFNFTAKDPIYTGEDIENAINSMKVVTEREIIKPYLDKLKETFIKRRSNWNCYGNEYESGRFESYDDCIDEVKELIEELLRESEDK